MPPNRADIVASLAADLASPRIVAAIDKVMRDLLDLRRIAVSLHGDPSQPTPVIVAGASEFILNDPPASPAKEQPLAGSIGTVGNLAHLYKTDERSPFHQLRFRTRENYTSLIKRIVDDCASLKLADLRKQDIQRIYDGWASDGKVSMPHSLITMLRSLVAFGTDKLEDRDCERLSVVLHKMHFTAPKVRSERMTVEQCAAIIKKAHEMGYRSIALAQAFQYDCNLGQKDVIGEWVPQSEPGVSDVIHDDQKWLIGLRWSDIDDAGVLRHQLSNGGKLIELSLVDAPFVMAELGRIKPVPRSGPIVVFEDSKRPYLHYQFRRVWREVADAAGIPRSVRNQDSRADAIHTRGERQTETARR